MICPGISKRIKLFFNNLLLTTNVRKINGLYWRRNSKTTRTQAILVQKGHQMRLKIDFIQL